MEVCRLCLDLQSDNNYLPLAGNYKDMVQVVAPELNLEISNAPVVCNECSSNLDELFVFKTKCFENEEKIRPKCENNKNKFRLKQVLDGTTDVEETALKPDKTKDRVCRTCMEPIESESFTILKPSEPDAYLDSMLTMCLNDIDLELTKDPVICESCMDNLQKLHHFKSTSLDVEDKLTNFCETHGTNSSEQINLNSVLEYEISKTDADSGFVNVKVENYEDESEDASMKSEMGSEMTVDSELKQEEIDIKSEAGTSSDKKMARKYLNQDELEDEVERFLAAEDSDDSVRDSEYSNSSPDESDDDQEIIRVPVIPAEPASLIWSLNFQEVTAVLFTGIKGIHGDLLQNNEVTPMDIFFSMIDDSVLELMVNETNRYASQMLESKTVTRTHRMHRWKNTDKQEMKTFLAVVLFMGIVNFPKIECYWKLDTLYYHPLMHKIKMSYNRFSLLLRCWHFVDNSLPRDGNDRLYKVSSLVDAVVANIQKVYTPGKIVAIDDSMILFRDPLKFRQYNPGKSSKYGIKIYKLCTPNGFVWNFNIYCGKYPTIEDLDKPGSVVVTLGEKLLNVGRLFITGNCYTSIPLALYLKKHNTDLCGTLRKNKSFLPKNVVNAKLKRGESIAMQANNITVLKWCDKREVLMLSTCEGNKMAPAGSRKDPDKTKPKIILQYNKGKQGLDNPDQMSSCCLRKSLIWYKKVAVELIAGSVIVNSWLIYNELHPGKNIRQLEFVELLLRQIFDFENNTTDPEPVTRNSHFLQEIPRKADGTIRRKRCHACYSRNKTTIDSDYAAKRTKQVSTECTSCRKAYCIKCFSENH